MKTIGCGTCVSTCETEESEVERVQGGNCYGIDRSIAGNGKCNASGFLWPYFQHDALACTSVDQKTKQEGILYITFIIYIDT